MSRRHYAWAFLAFVALHVLTPGRNIGLIELRAVFSRAAPKQPLPTDDRRHDDAPGLDAPFGKTVPRGTVQVELALLARVPTQYEPIHSHLAFNEITDRLPPVPDPSPQRARAPPSV